VPALNLFRNEMDSSHKQLAQDTQIFRDKLVIFGVTAQALYDLKSAPVGAIYPGVEAQTTAIDNLMSGDRVQESGGFLAALIVWLASLAAAIGVILPRQVIFKVLAAALAAAALIGFAVLWFLGPSIHWLPLASPLLALLLAVVGAFAFTYFVEDRQRRFVLKALGQYISPEVAAEIERDPDSLKLFGRRREMTVMFTDIQGFTDLSESMESEKLSAMLNFYLGEMSALVLQRNGTLDKYIGDAIMSFWNAPSLQPDHAALACRAALAMRDREAQIQDQLGQMGAAGLLTRIGINTGPMVFGNLGSPQKFNYTVLGDSVNLGSRLEGANKFYGSRILVAETTVAITRDQFVYRELDLLRVKGKQKPLAVFELLQEGSPDPATRDRIERYGQALKLYRAQKWDEAEAVLNALHAQYPDDIPAAYLLKRIGKLRLDPPPPDWDGVYVAKDK
jgi:adenylate cyclase